MKDDDSIAELTGLLHRAYRPLAEAGMRFLASHQDETTTRRRCAERECWLAVEGNRLVGTIAWRVGGATEKCSWYCRHDVAIFGQFAVEPEFQSQGIGSRLLETVERRVQEQGFAEIACDTSERAEALITFYRRRGYRFIESVQWDMVNYRSSVLSKTILDPSG